MTSTRSLPKLCTRCGRNYQKVAVRNADGTTSVYCPDCYSGQTDYLVANDDSRTVRYDHRKRGTGTLAVLEADGLWHRTQNGKTTQCGHTVEKDALERWDWRTLPPSKLCRACSGLSSYWTDEKVEELA